VHGSVAHCQDNDIHPARCDHLVENQRLITVDAIMAILVVAALLVLGIKEDIQQARDEQQLLLHRIQSISLLRQRVLLVLWW